MSIVSAMEAMRRKIEMLERNKSVQFQTNINLTKEILEIKKRLEKISSDNPESEMIIFGKPNKHGDYNGLQKCYIDFNKFTVVEKDKLREWLKTTRDYNLIFMKGEIEKLLGDEEHE